MSNMKMDVTFSVNAETKLGEVVCIVGDCPELGNWDPHKAKPLTLETRAQDG